MSPQFHLDQAEALFKKAERQGASGGDILVVEGSSFSTTVRLNEVEKISSALGKTLGLRLFFGKRSAITSTSDFSPASLEQLVSDTCTLAQLTPEDTCSGLPSFEACATSPPDLDLLDPDIVAVSLQEKIELAKRAEKAAMAYDPRLINSDGAEFGHYQTTVLYVATNRFSGTFGAAGASLSVVPIASFNGQMQRDYWYTSRRKWRKLESPESVGQIAAKRALRRLGARKITTQQVPVVFDPEVAASLLGHLASAISGYALYKQASFLTDQLHQQIASETVTVYDDPTLLEGLGSSPFDGEGLPSYKKTIVQNGVLKSYLLDTYSGKKLGLPSTGNAVRSPASSPSVGVSNFHLMNGLYSQEEIIASVKSGLYVTELIGFGVNMVTGDYSRGAVGFWIENGELSYPVEEITIAGNLKEMFRQIEMVGSDLDVTRSLSAPTLKIARMTVAGN